MAYLAWAVGRLWQLMEGSPLKISLNLQLIPFVDNKDITHRPGKSIPHVDCLSHDDWLWDKPIRSGGYGGRISRDMDRRISKPSNQACVLGTSRRGRSKKKVGWIGGSVHAWFHACFSHQRYTPAARAKTGRLWRFSRDGDVEEPDGPEVEKFCFVFLFFFLSVFHACIQELWDIARRAGGPVRGGRPSSWGLAAWRLGAKAAG
jgi:hypothetical protein